MQLGVHNQIPLGKTRGAFARFIASLLILCLLFKGPQAVATITPGAAMGIPQVANLVALILAVNYAMEEASKNPQNQPYRDRVRRAVSMLPPAIMAVAAVFKAGKQLHNADLPIVQAMLGGFVDVNAPDKYKNFFKNPDPSLIPKLGDKFPSGVKPANIDNGALVASPALAKAGPQPASVSGPASPEIVSLKESWAPNVTSSNGGVKKGDSYGYDESGAKVGAGGELGAVGNVGGAGNTGAGNARAASQLSSSFGYDENNAKDENGTPFLQGVATDISTIESRMTAVGVPIRTSQLATGTPAQDSLRSEKENFFKKANVGQDEEVEEEEGRDLDNRAKAKAKAKAKNVTRDPASKNYKIRLKPKYWQFNPILDVIEALVVENAQAGGDGCDEEQGGSKAAEILMAIAMIIAAIAPMVVASIQAEADKAIARINAETTIKTTQIQADTSKYLANVQKDVALRQAQIAQDISKQNNDGQSQRLNMQLAELRSARDDARKSEQEKRAIEQKYNQDRIALAQKQADDNVKLAKQTLNANLTQAGLVTGATAKNSTNALSVAKTGLPTSTATASTAIASAGGTATAGGAGLGGSATALPSGGGTVGGALAGASGPSLGFTSSSPVRKATSPQNSLLANLEEPQPGNKLTVSSKPRKARRGVRGATSAYGRGIASVQMSADEAKVNATLQNGIAAGSSPGQIHLAAPGGQISAFKSELAAANTPQSKDKWFSLEGEPHRAAAPAPAPSASPGGHSSRGFNGGYNTPAGAETGRLFANDMNE